MLDLKLLTKNSYERQKKYKNPIIWVKIPDALTFLFLTELIFDQKFLLEPAAHGMGTPKAEAGDRVKFEIADVEFQNNSKNQT
mgnify:CR=1 FL=1